MWVRKLLALSVFVLALGGDGLAVRPAGARLVGGSLDQVTDLQGAPIDPPSSPAELTVAGGWLYFRGEDAVHGTELWRTDGTPGGAERVADLCPGVCSSSPRGFAALGDRVLFIASESPERPFLWASDGSPDGTVPLAEVPRHPIFAVPHPLDDRLAVFAGSDPETGIEPWVTDGTPEGTALLADLCPGECSSDPIEAAPVPGGLAFLAGPGPGLELYRTDGTPEGTAFLADVCPAACEFDPRGLTPLGGRLFFSADDGVHGVELWTTDGTEAGTGLFLDLTPGHPSSYPSPVVAFAGHLYFSADGRRWRTDGTVEGTVPTDELEPHGAATEGDHFTSYGFTVAGTRLYFGVLAQGVRDELWVLDHPGGAPRLLRGGFLAVLWGSGPGRAAALGDHLVFAANVTGSGIEPWVTDGSPEGTRRLADIAEGTDPSFPSSFAAFRGRVFFEANDRIHDQELWATGGTPEGTELVENVNPPVSSAKPRELRALGGALYFVAEGRDGAGLWRHRPGEAGPELLTPVARFAMPVAVGGRLFLVGRSDRGLAILDPEGGGFTELTPHGGDADLVAAGDRFVFDVSGLQIWSTDGTPAGTRKLRSWGFCETDIGIPVPPTIELTGAGGAAFFLVETEECETELWRSDGTAEGTVRVELPDPDLWLVSLAPLGERRLVAQGQLGSSAVLWVLDARDGTTTAVIEPGSWHFPGLRLVPAGSLLYLVEEDALGRRRLWRTDGTPDGTFPLVALGPVNPGGPETAVAGGLLFFTRIDEEHGEELWATDGTVAGTGLVRDVRPGPRNSLPRALTAVGEGVVFAADGGVAGHEPWWSDGTPEGTVRLADAAPGRAASSPEGFAAVGDVVYFDADDGRSGRELWSVTLVENPAPPAEATPIDAPELPGFRLWVRISAGGEVLPSRREAACIPETVCVSGAVPGRSELFVRIVGPKPNGRLWPTLVRFSTSTLEVWIEQLSTGIVRHYRLEAARPGSSSLDGLFDRQGFEP